MGSWAFGDGSSKPVSAGTAHNDADHARLDECLRCPRLSTTSFNGALDL